MRGTGIFSQRSVSTKNFIYIYYSKFFLRGKYYFPKNGERILEKED